MQPNPYIKGFLLASAIMGCSSQASKMAIHTELPEALEEVDIIIAGGETFL
jgi:hypothetical protein